MKTIRRYAVVVAVALFVLFMLSHVPRIGVDFEIMYLAGRALWNLQNPYTAQVGFFNPPWMLLLVAPVALLEIQTARWVWFALGLASYLLAFKRLKLPDWSIILLLFSPFLYYDLAIGNYEWLILLGATLPAAFSAWIVILKPQTATILFALWLKQRKWKVLIPVAVLASLFILRIYNLPKTADMPWSADLWPYGIPIGLVLAWFALKRNDMLLALAAAPFLSPYVGMQTWIMVLLPLTRNKYALIAGVLVGWVCLFLFTWYAAVNAHKMTS